MNSIADALDEAAKEEKAKLVAEQLQQAVKQSKSK
jgi:hypothetical protein